MSTIRSTNLITSPELTTIAGRSVYGDPAFEIAVTGMWNGRTAHTFNVLGRRASWTANVLNDLVMFTPSAGSSTTINEMTGAETLEIISSNTADAAAGTGVRTVKITYINALSTVGAQVETTVTMNGTTAVSLGAVRALAIQFIEAATAGSGAVAAGDITIRSTATPTNIYDMISAGGNASLSGRYMVPVGYTALGRPWITSAVNQDMDTRLRATVSRATRAIVAPYLFQDAAYPAAGAIGPARDLHFLKFPALSKIKISSMPPATTGNPRCEASFTLHLIAD